MIKYINWINNKLLNDSLIESNWLKNYWYSINLFYLINFELMGTGKFCGSFGEREKYYVVKMTQGPFIEV